MRNLKRALSLTLASVMLLGMMVVGSSAAAGYDDVADTDNVEAIEVLQAVEVMVGDERGFGPERPVNRAEMAVVMGKLLNLDYNYYEATCPFNDVYDWARGWVGACYANGIVSGRGEGVYDPGTTVTAVEAASMLMRALGYFKYQSDYANGFEVATVSQATKIRLFDGVDSKTNAPLTRNQVAQMVLNALKSGVVEPDGNALNFIDANGNVIATGGKVNYVYTTSNKSFATAISSVNASSMGSYNDAPIVELGEQLYNGDLKLNDTTDVFGRPARQWEYDAKEIGTYVKKELLKQEYTTEVTGKMLYTLLTKPTVDKYDFTISIDGIQCVEANRVTLGEAYFTEANLVNTNTKAVGATDNGVLTQVFVDPDKDNQDVYIAVINTYLAKAVDDYKTNKEEVDFTVWSVENKGSRSDIVLVKNTEDSEVLTVKNEDIFVEDVKEDDIVLVRVAEGEIQEIYDPEVIDNTEISAFKEGSWVNANGTQYDYADSIQYDTEVLDEYDDKNMKDTTYRVFLDMYGYAIGVEIVDDAEDYVFLTGIDLNTSNLYNKTADGNVIHLDGTMETVRINMDDSRNAYNEKFNSNTNKTRVNSLMNTWCTFSVDSKGVYTLTEVANDNYSFLSKFTGDTVKPYTETEKRQNDKLGQGHNSNAVVLDKAHAGLMGIEDNNSGFKTVHANDDSVFLTVKTELITATDVLSTGLNKYPSIIVNDVDSVETGIQNVDLKAYTAQGVIDSDTKYAASKVDPKDVSHGVYTLFKDNGYVVAAVVVGEDDGTSTNYAYITGTVKQESYDKNADEWTWSINAIVNGEQVTLEEKGSTSKYLKSMGKGEWYEVKYKSDGTVRKAEYIASETTQGAHTSSAYIFCEDVTHVTNNGYPKFIGLMEMKEASYDAGNNTIVLYQNLMTEKDGYVINAKGRTLQIDTHRDYLHRDLTVTSNAKVVLVQDTRRVDNLGRPISDKVDIMDRIEDCGEGQNGLKKAVDWLEDNETFYGWVGAIIEDGVATSVIIWDRTAYEINIGGGNRPVSGDATLVWDKYDEEWTLTIPAKDYRDNLTTAEIADWLAKAGCTEISKTRSGWNFVRNGMTYNDQIVNVVPRGDLKVTVYDIVDGNSKQVDSWWTEAGESETIDIGSYTGYEVDTLYVDGNDVTEDIRGGSYTFTMPNHDVVVKVTFKKTETPPVGGPYTASKDEADENFVNGAIFKMYNDKTGEEIALTDEIAAGSVIRFEPNAVLNAAAKNGTVEKGTNNNGQTVWTVNGDFVVSSDETKYVWLTKAGTLGLFETGWYDLDLNLVWQAPAARFAMARANGDPVEAEDFLSTINGEKAAVEVVVPYGNGTVTWLFWKVDGELQKAKPVFDKVTDVAGAIRYTLNHLSEYKSLTERSIPGGEDPKPPVSDKFISKPIWAEAAPIATNEIAVTFFAWLDKADTKTLTVTEIAQALTDAGYPTKATNVDLTKVVNGKYVAKTDNDYTATFAPAAISFVKDGTNPKVLYKVSYPGGMIYIKQGDTTTKLENVDIKDAAGTNAYLIPDTSKSATSAVTLTKDKKTGWTSSALAAPTTDVTYVEALPFKAGMTYSNENCILGDNSGTYDLKGVCIYDTYIEGADGKIEPLKCGAGATVYAVKGTKITLKTYTGTSNKPGDLTLAVGQEIVLSVNGKEQVITVEKADEAPEATVVVDGVNLKEATPAFTLTVGVKPVTAASIPVYLDGQKIEPTAGDKTKYEIRNMIGKTVACEDRFGDLKAVGTPLTVDSVNNIITYTVNAADAKYNGVSNPDKGIYLCSAFTVASNGTGYGWTAWADVEGTKAVNTNTYFRTDGSGYVYVRAADQSTVSQVDLVWAKDLSNNGITLDKDAMDETANNGYDVWKVRVDRSIGATDLTYGAYINRAANQLRVLVPGISQTQPAQNVSVGGLLLTNGVKILKATMSGGDMNHTYSVTANVDSSGTGVIVDITMLSGTGITTSGAGVGTIRLELSTGMVVEVPVVCS